LAWNVEFLDTAKRDHFSKPLPAAEFERLLRAGRKLSLPAAADLPEQTSLPGER